jgi:hypothetical protein
VPDRRPRGLRSVPAVLGRGRERVAGLVGHRFPTVAVTGMTGVGKTELVDHLCGRADDGDPGTPDAGSAVLERRTRRSARLTGFRFRVVPGDNAAARLGALDEVFHDDPVDGVLHLVADGRATGRRPAGTSGAATVSREAQLAAELDDWAITAHRVAAMAVRRPRPTWLVVVVTKIDLVTEPVEDVVARYSPGSGTPFGDRLDELRALAGGANLSVDVLPVSSHLGPGADKAARRARDAHLAALTARMAQLAGHV